MWRGVVLDRWCASAAKQPPLLGALPARRPPARHPPPFNALTAFFSRQARLRQPRAIAVRPKGAYTEIVGVRFA